MTVDTRVSDLLWPPPVGDELLVIVFSNKAFLSCEIAESAPVIVFISKLFAMDRTTLPQHRSR